MPYKIKVGDKYKGKTIVSFNFNEENKSYKVNLEDGTFLTFSSQQFKREFGANKEEKKEVKGEEKKEVKGEEKKEGIINRMTRKDK
jgi:hypothetical protein